MGRILRDMSSDPSIGPVCGFKGGTCAYFFYDLPRFSVDLDFDLLVSKHDKEKHIEDTLMALLGAYGKVKDIHTKRNTIFALLSYGSEDHNIKVEISTRTTLPDLRDKFEVKDYLGIPLLAARKEYLFATKLAALTLRSETAMRDVFDIHFFATQQWDIDKEVVKKLSGLSFGEHIGHCIEVVSTIDNTYIGNGLGELLSERDKIWVNKNLKSETLFLLKNYQQAMS